MQEKENKPQYMYAILDKRTGKPINRKCKGNPYYVSEKAARNKIYDEWDELATYELKRVNT